MLLSQALRAARALVSRVFWFLFFCFSAWLSQSLHSGTGPTCRTAQEAAEAAGGNVGCAGEAQ